MLLIYRQQLLRQFSASYSIHTRTVSTTNYSIQRVAQWCKPSLLWFENVLDGNFPTDCVSVIVDFYPKSTNCIYRWKLSTTMIFNIWRSIQLLKLHQIRICATYIYTVLHGGYCWYSKSMFWTRWDISFSLFIILTSCIKISCMVSHSPLTVWFAWCVVFVSRYH